MGTDGSANAFHTWAKCLDNLVFWARVPDISSDGELVSTMRDEWRDSMKRALSDIGNQALDAATDDVASRKVVRSRSLALDLVRTLNTSPDLNEIPCRQWPYVEQNIVNQLVDLAAYFAVLGDGDPDESAEPMSQASHLEPVPVSNHKPNRPRVDIDPIPQITIDGTAFSLTSDSARYLDVLIKHKDWLSDPKYRELHGSENDRPDRWRKNLHPEVLTHIETEKGKGTRWKLA